MLHQPGHMREMLSTRGVDRDPVRLECACETTHCSERVKILYSLLKLAELHAVQRNRQPSRQVFRAEMVAATSPRKRVCYDPDPIHLLKSLLGRSMAYLLWLIFLTAMTASGVLMSELNRYPTCSPGKGSGFRRVTNPPASR